MCIYAIYTALSMNLKSFSLLTCSHLDGKVITSPAIIVTQQIRGCD